MPELYDYGPRTLDIKLMQGDDFSMTVDIAGDRDADTFTAKLAYTRTGVLTSFGITLGSYDSGAGTTPVTLTLADSVTDALEAGAYTWDLQWVSGTSTRTVLAGALEVLRDVT